MWFSSTSSASRSGALMASTRALTAALTNGSARSASGSVLTVYSSEWRSRCAHSAAAGAPRSALAGASGSCTIVMSTSSRIRAMADAGSSPARRHVLTLATRVPLSSCESASWKSITATIRTGTRVYPAPASVLPPGCHCCT